MSSEKRRLDLLDCHDAGFKPLAAGSTALEHPGEPYGVLVTANRHRIAVHHIFNAGKYLSVLFAEPEFRSRDFKGKNLGLKWEGEAGSG